MVKPIIKVENLRKVYRIGDQKVVALNKIDIEIYEGEICCLLGTSGSGKSTLLNMMAGLEKPTKGTVNIAGTAVEKLSEKRLANFRQLNVGFVFQAYNLLTSLTALDNVAMPLVFSGVSKKQRVKKSKEMLKAVGLAKHMHHRPTQMSGGQQQRVGIARAFVALPKIVFCDEPTGNLDSKTTLEIMALIINLAKVNNQTLVIVTHDPSIASYADRIIHILDGNVAKTEVNENPTKPVVPTIEDKPSIAASDKDIDDSSKKIDNKEKQQHKLSAQKEKQ